ncbi:MAG: hypothetical protein CML20_08070 [Rheinheimera sp.]|uniref:hypothetical protein n=1 Tax=Arsukibacterium sp. UBA3155 TaxID=1946058 RepID=UPI000C8C55DF|nr:hypothetical protein [Arsukibacterium sp. UBA3155]MAD74731.1 hypothetical protein [Rheinheimera sp.]|tara:strand:- start:12053 stop:12382 length:330 start_codon:yes stop_codon:yes gene_type:complete
MRWFSSLIILVYLSLLCSPQALAVQQSRVAPLVETQLQGLTPAIQSAFHQQYLVSDDTDSDEPFVALTASHNVNLTAATAGLIYSLHFTVATIESVAHSARAPPVFRSL